MELDHQARRDEVVSSVCHCALSGVNRADICSHLAQSSHSMQPLLSSVPVARLVQQAETKGRGR